MADGRWSLQNYRGLLCGLEDFLDCLFREIVFAVMLAAQFTLVQIRLDCIAKFLGNFKLELGGKFDYIQISPVTD